MLIAQLQQELDHVLVCAAVKRTLQSSYAAGDRRINVGERSGGHPRGEGGRVQLMIYRIQQKLGRAFADLQPYALYPPSEYFHGAVTRNELGPLPAGPQKQQGRPQAFSLPLSA